MSAQSTYTKIYQIVAQIPSGRVSTYGRIARLAGFGGNARIVGYALHNLRNDNNIPWHRVVNHRGRISCSAGRSQRDHLQRSLLESEGVKFDLNGVIDLSRFNWTEQNFKKCVISI